jgi:glycosyltransferase involved in cell wall biosynthesis
VGHVREEKGILILLESLQWIAEAGAVSVRCDIYGPIYDSINDRFFDGLRRTPNAQYKGVVPADRVIATMRTYDAFVFPTHYSGEGHPGVLVEAMMAGLPIVATRFRSLPELIEHEANGLLVEPGDVGSLVEAITELAADPVLRESMAAKSRRMAERYDSRSVVKTILGIVGIQKPTSAEPASWQLH